MTFRGFIPRSEWGARSPRSRSTNIQPTGSLAHWMGGRVGHISHARCFDYIRGVQEFHMDRDTGRGWVDIAYSMLPCRHGYVFAGRGAGIRTAANGTNAANGAYHAIAVMVGEGDDLTQDAIDAMWWSWDSLGRGDIGDHRDVRATTCPGPALARATDQKPKEITMADGHQHPHPDPETFTHSGFKSHFDELIKAKIFSEDTAPGDIVETGQLAVYLTKYRDRVVGPLKSEVAALRSQVAALQTKLNGHTTDHPTGGASGEIPDHRHSADGTTGGVAR